MKKTIIPIRGMHCHSCEILIRDELTQIKNIQKVNISHKTGKATIYSNNDLDSNELTKAIKKSGYQIGETEATYWLSKNQSDYEILLKSATIIAGIYLILLFTGNLDKLGKISINSSSLPLVFMIGLTAGVSTCMALVGGLILSISTKYAQANPKAKTSEKIRPQIIFNLGRIIGFFILGGIIGLVGNTIQISPSISGLITILVGIIMLILGLQLTKISPKISNINLSLPASIANLLRIKPKSTSSYSDLKTLLMGATTFFLPCGFTQTMQLMAISTGNFLQAGTVMAVFALGTTPGLLGISSLTAIIKGENAQKFYRFAGLIVVLFALFNINNGLNLTGWKTKILTSSTQTDSQVTSNLPAQTIKAIYTKNGLEPYSIPVKAGTKTTLKINVQADGQGCMSSMTIPGLDNKMYRVKKGNTLVFSFTAPKGKHNITCSMGMLHGNLIAN